MQERAKPTSGVAPEGARNRVTATPKALQRIPLGRAWLDDPFAWFCQFGHSTCCVVAALITEQQPIRSLFVKLMDHMGRMRLLAVCAAWRHFPRQVMAVALFVEVCWHSWHTQRCLSADHCHW